MTFHVSLKRKKASHDAWFGNVVRVHELTLLPNHTLPSLILSTVEGGSGFVPPCVVSGLVSAVHPRSCVESSTTPGYTQWVCIVVQTLT